MTGQIPQSFIEELLARTDIAEIIGGRISLRRAGANFIACCPFHQEKTPSFTVSVTKQFYHCFGCGVSGDAIQFLTEHDGLHFVEAVETLASRAGLVMPIGTQESNQAARSTPVYEILAEAAVFYQTQLRKHVAAEKAHHYLKKRGLTGQIAKQFGLGFAPPGWDALIKHLGADQTRKEALILAGLVVKKEAGRYYDRFRDRILFPIRDRRGRVVGFGGRVMGSEGEPKYLNSPETLVFNKGSELYGLYEARLGNRALTSLLVVEGYMDVVSLAQFGIKNVVATLGTAVTEKQVDALFRQASELIFCFDGDKAGQAAAKRALPLILPHMKEGRRVRFMLLPAGEDPDSLVRKLGQVAFLDRVERASLLSDFLFEDLTAHLDLHHLDSRAQLVTLAKPLIKLVPPGVLQQMLYDRLAELAGVSPQVLQTKYGNQKKNTVSNRAVRELALPPSPAYQLVAMMLEHRELVLKAGESTEFRGLEMAGVNLLCAAIEILRFDSTIGIEAFKEQLPENCISQFSYDALKRIVDRIPPGGVDQEFLGALQNLRGAAQEQAMESLLIKAKTGVLSTDEKAQLKNLLAQREKNRVD
ncbi:MAG TPA: DNA primase [Gammaproteobacteria bacterium]|nr:DNA primase [Gammaproteobacteria bacterium]